MKHEGKAKLSFVDKAAVKEKGPADEKKCQIDVTDVEFEHESDGEGAFVEAVVVSGLAWGTTTIASEIESAALPTPLSAESAVRGHEWSARVELPASSVPYGATLAITARAKDVERCDAEATRTVVLREPSDVQVLPAYACAAGLEAERNRFVAGYADRLVTTRIFTPLLCSFWTPTVSTRLELGRAVRRLGLTRDDAFGLADAFVQRAEKLGREFERGQKPDGGVDLQDAYDVVSRALDESVKEKRPKKEKGKGKGKAELRGSESGGVKAEVVLSPAIGGLQIATVQPLGGESDEIDVPATFAERQAVVATAEGMPIGVEAGASQYFDLGWLGILFYDRLRFRPSGLVAGDHIYSLSLAPGEEATLTQRSETKRTKSFEEIIDRTQERELEFSSTWTTDVSQQDTNTQSSSFGGNLGVSVGVPIAEAVEAEISGGINAQSANSTTATRQQARTQQVTSRFAAKTREQHKTTFRVGIEAIEEFGSRRVIRNANPAHALTLHFYKLYQKHRVLLERYDAKLCCSFCVSDPGRDLRTELEDELRKLDPVVPPGACPDVPAAGTQTVSLTIPNQNAADWGGDEYGYATFATLLPAGTVLSSWSFEITRWRVDDGGGNVYDAIPSQFFQHGGKWNFTSGTPVVGAGGGQSHDVRVLMPEAWGPGWWTVSVDGRFTWSYAASDAVSTEVRQCIEDVKKKIRDSFSQARVFEILEEVRASREELVYKRLFESSLLPGYYGQGVNPPCDLLERVRNYFDWNEAVIEYLPWWLTASGRQRRDELRKRLLGLPGDVRSDLIIDDFLIASAARVYLPIRTGRELEAIALLTQTNLGACITDFRNWRETSFGRIDRPLPTFDAVGAVGPALATPEGADDWQYDWERPRRRMLVLDEWSELLPTDGVHTEPALSACGGTDALRTTALVADLAREAAARESELARAELERSIAAKEHTKQVTVVIGDPGGAGV